MKKLIYVPGFTGKCGDTQIFKLILGKKFEILYFDYDTHLREPLEQFSGMLNEFVEEQEWSPGEKGNLVGISAGGIIADYYLKFLGNSRIDKFVTVCSPFNGTYLAYAPLGRRGLDDLKRNSPFLEKLSQSNLNEDIKAKYFWSPFDWVVVPGYSARKDSNSETSFFPCHPLNEFWPPLVKKVGYFLEEEPLD